MYEVGEGREWVVGCKKPIQNSAQRAKTKREEYTSGKMKRNKRWGRGIHRFTTTRDSDCSGVNGWVNAVDVCGMTGWEWETTWTVWSRNQPVGWTTKRRSKNEGKILDWQPVARRARWSWDVDERHTMRRLGNGEFEFAFCNDATTSLKGLRVRLPIVPVASADSHSDF